MFRGSSSGRGRDRGTEPPPILAMSEAWQRVERRTWFRTSAGVRVSQCPDYTEKPDAACVHAWGRVRLHVENGVAAPTRVHTIPKGALIMGITTRFQYQHRRLRGEQ